MNWGAEKRIQLFLEDFEDWLYYEVELNRVTPDEKRFVELLIDTYLEEVRVSTLHKSKMKKLFNGD